MANKRIIPIGIKLNQSEYGWYVVLVVNVVILVNKELLLAITQTWYIEVNIRSIIQI